MQTTVLALSLCVLFSGCGLTLSVSPEKYSFTYREPRGCSLSSGNCNYFVGIQKNANHPKYLDFYLEGKTSGWVAIGFSTTANMFNTDALGCVRSGSQVGAVDTWSKYRDNILDKSQNDIVQNKASYRNGRISCSFSRLIAASDVGQDYNLLSQAYWQLYVIGPNQQSGRLPRAFNYHGQGHGNIQISRRPVRMNLGGSRSRFVY